MGYHIFDTRLDIANLNEETLENTIPAVTITHATVLPREETIQLPGNILAWFQAPIYAQVSGYVEAWYKDFGAIVTKGEVLAEISAPALDAQYRQSKADLAAQQALFDLAKLTADRYLALRKNHAVSEQSISVKVAQAKAQAAKVNAAEQKVKDFEALVQLKTIIAPYDGVIIERNIYVGDFINKEGTINTPAGEIRNLFTVADIRRMRLFVNVPESFESIIHHDLTANITVPQFPNRLFTAEFPTIVPGFDVNTRTIVTEFVIENEDQALWPGSYATVYLAAQVEKDLLSIPSSTVVFQEHGTEIAIVDDDNRVHFKPIVVNRVLDSTVEVIKGVSINDRIINNPSATLLESDKVHIATPKPGYNLIKHPELKLKPSSEPTLNESYSP